MKGKSISFPLDIMLRAHQHARAWKYMCARAHPLGAAPNFHACAEKKDKSAHAHVGVHEA